MSIVSISSQNLPAEHRVNHIEGNSTDHLYTPYSQLTICPISTEIDTEVYKRIYLSRIKEGFLPGQLQSFSFLGFSEDSKILLHLDSTQFHALQRNVFASVKPKITIQLPASLVLFKEAVKDYLCNGTNSKDLWYEVFFRFPKDPDAYNATLSNGRCGALSMHFSNLLAQGISIVVEKHNKLSKQTCRRGLIKYLEEQKKSVNDPFFSNYVDNIWTKEERDTSGRIKNLSMVNENNQCSLDTLLTWAQSNSSRSLNIFHTICSEKDVDQNPDLANWFFLLHSSFGNDIAKFNYDTISKLHMFKSTLFSNAVHMWTSLKPETCSHNKPISTGQQYV